MFVRLLISHVTNHSTTPIAISEHAQQQERGSAGEVGHNTTLNFTLSPTPRRLIAAKSSMNPMATAVITPYPGTSIQPLISRPPKKFWASTFAEVEALVMPEQTTANATTKARRKGARRCRRQFRPSCP